MCGWGHNCPACSFGEDRPEKLREDEPLRVLTPIHGSKAGAFLVVRLVPGVEEEATEEEPIIIPCSSPSAFALKYLSRADLSSPQGPLSAQDLKEQKKFLPVARRIYPDFETLEAHVAFQKSLMLQSYKRGDTAHLAPFSPTRHKNVFCYKRELPRDDPAFSFGYTTLRYFLHFYHTEEEPELILTADSG